MSALPAKANMVQHDRDVCFVPCVDSSGLAMRFRTLGGQKRFEDYFEVEREKLVQ
jgi:hypothetical protein